MFEFFIALFGGLYYGGKFLKKKAELAAYDNKDKIRASVYDNIESEYVASAELERYAKDLILKGKHYDDICSWFADDFRYVFGSKWKEILNIPRNGIYIPTNKSCKDDPFSVPANHIMWVYHLLLAKKGKIDHNIPYRGYPIGGINDKNMNIKFAECVEGQLLNAGVSNARLVFELDTLCGTRRRTADEVCGGHIKIESTCVYPTHRLWDDYIQK